MKNEAEARVELLTLGALIVIFAFFWLGNIREPLAMTLGGVVLLGSGLYQSQHGWHVSVLTWALGVVLFLGGIGVQMFVVAYVRVNWVAIALVLIGIYALFQALSHRE